MLRVVLNIDPGEHITNEHMYSGLPKLGGDRVVARRMKLAGHCHESRHRELPASMLVLWEPNDGPRHPGRQTLTYMDLLKKDAGVSSSQELAG